MHELNLRGGLEFQRAVSFPSLRRELANPRLALELTTFGCADRVREVVSPRFGEGLRQGLAQVAAANS